MRERAAGEKDKAGIKEQPARAQQQQETQVAPAVAPRAQMRRARPPRRCERGGHFVERETAKRRTDDHLARELHPRRAQPEREDPVAAKAAQAAVEIADGNRKEQAAEKAQDRIAEITMQKRHRPGLDAAFEPVADDEIAAAAQAREKWLQVSEVVAAVGVADDDVRAAGRVNSPHERSPVPADRHGHDPGAVRLGDADRSVGAAVVGDQHFAVDALALEECARFVDAGGERLGLVEARHQDRELEVGRRLIGHGSAIRYRAEVWIFEGPSASAAGGGR